MLENPQWGQFILKTNDDVFLLESNVSQLLYPVYFVLNTNNWDDIVEKFKSQNHAELSFSDSNLFSANNLWDRMLNAEDCWTVQTFLHLRSRGLNVYLVKDFVPDAICITTMESFRLRRFPVKSYLIICRHDRGRPEVADQRIVQNQLNIIDNSDNFILHWPQPGLIPRDEKRGLKIQKITYKGLLPYLAEPFRSDQFVNELSKIGVTLDISQGNLKKRIGDWRDYSTADLVLAVRDCTEYDLSIKPPSKLVNAWLARCPAILSPEPAYQALRKDEYDYIQVSSPEEVIDSILHLQNNPDLYQALIDRCVIRSLEYNVNTIANMWYDLLVGPIFNGYEQWLSCFSKRTLVSRYIRYFWKAFFHKKQIKYHLHHVNFGPRPLFSKKGASSTASPLSEITSD